MWTGFSTNARKKKRQKFAQQIAVAMWTVKPAAMPVQFLRGSTGTLSVEYPHPLHRCFCNFSKKSQNSETESVERLGQTIFLRSDDSNDSKPLMSGSDVLLAIQKARAQRKRSIAGKKKAKKVTDMKQSSSTDESSGDNGVDHSNVRPLRIKSDWGHKLEEFEKLLKALLDMEL